MKVWSEPKASVAARRTDVGLRVNEVEATQYDLYLVDSLAEELSDGVG